MKRYAFTLAELLITMGIIGIIAVLTVPNVSRDIFGRSNKVKLKTTYESLSTSLRTLLVNEHASDLTDTTLFFEDDGPEIYVNKYLNVTKVCSDNNGKDCFADTYKSPQKSYSYAQSKFGGDYCAALNTAAVLCINLGKFDNNTSTTFWVDVNGAEGPNIIGKDLFYLPFNEKGELDFFDKVEEPTCDYTDAEINKDLEETVMSCTVYILSGEI